MFSIGDRLSTERHCDNSVVMDKGRIVESGTHDALLDINGYYARVHEYQNHSPVVRAMATPSALSTEAWAQGSRASQGSSSFGQTHDDKGGER